MPVFFVRGFNTRSLTGFARRFCFIINFMMIAHTDEIYLIFGKN